MPEERLTTAFSDVAEVASLKTGDQLPLVVGGQAVNIWASVYSARIGLPLQSYAPPPQNRFVETMKKGASPARHRRS